MGSAVAHAGHRRVPGDAQPGRRVAIASLLMVPALLVSYVAAFFLGVAFQHALGLAEDEMLTEAGVRGVIAAVPVMALLVTPQIVGIALGVKARRLGERPLGTVGVVLNSVIATFLLLVSVLQLAFA